MSDYVFLNDMTRQITYTKTTPLEEEMGISGHYHISALRYTKTQRWSWVSQIMICFSMGLGAQRRLLSSVRRSLATLFLSDSHAPIPPFVWFHICIEYPGVTE